jgi:hypothetical protein
MSIYDNSNCSDNELTLDKDYDPFLQFRPYVGYKASDALNLNLEIEVGFGTDDDLSQKKVTYDIYAKLKAEYNIGHGLAGKAWYVFRTADYDLDGKDNLTRHTIQLEMVWSF